MFHRSMLSEKPSPNWQLGAANLLVYKILDLARQPGHSSLPDSPILYIPYLISDLLYHSVCLQLQD
jgi:hypothetical protein